MKRYFRFSLRSLFIVMTLLIIFGGVELSRQARQSKAVAAIRKMSGCYLDYDFDLASTSPEWKPHLPTIRSTVSGWYRGCTGSDFFSPAVRLSGMFDASDSTFFKTVSELRHLRWLHAAPANLFPSTGIDCPSLEPLQNCTQLEYLVLGSWALMRPDGTPPYNGTGTTLLPLNISPDQIQPLTQLPNLRVLAIGGNRLNDAALDQLKILRQLQYLYLSNDQLSDKAFEELAGALSKTKIIRMNDKSTDYSAEVYSRF